MKILTPIALLILLSCGSPTEPDPLHAKISEFYATSVQNYTPIAYSDMDTLENLSVNGSIVRLTATMTHKFSDGNNNRVDTFDVTMFKDDVIAIPRGY